MTNIAKGECRGKRKSYFRIGSAEPYPIFYKYSERGRKDKATNFIFIRVSKNGSDFRYFYFL